MWKGKILYNKMPILLSKDDVDIFVIENDG